ncbi:MAG: hypothetical protein WD512_12700, partial [Candidatus Paceibacterota bacterium]
GFEYSEEQFHNFNTMNRQATAVDSALQKHQIKLQTYNREMSSAIDLVGLEKADIVIMHGINDSQTMRWSDCLKATEIGAKLLKPKTGLLVSAAYGFHMLDSDCFRALGLNPIEAISPEVLIGCQSNFARMSPVYVTQRNSEAISRDMARNPYEQDFQDYLKL